MKPSRIGFALAFAMLLGGCAGHPVDCATGLVAWSDCAPGTAGYQRRQNSLDQDADRCSGYGYTPGTDGYAHCRMSMDQNRDRAHDALLGAVVAGSLARPAPVIARPSITNCTSVGSSTNCTSY